MKLFRDKILESKKKISRIKYEPFYTVFDTFKTFSRNVHYFITCNGSSGACYKIQHKRSIEEKCSLRCQKRKTGALYPRNHSLGYSPSHLCRPNRSISKTTHFGRVEFRFILTGVGFRFVLVYIWL